MTAKIAIRPKPRIHEQFSGYLLRLAHRNHLGVADIIRHLFPERPTSSYRSEFLTLDEADTDRVAEALDLSRPLAESLLFWTPQQRPVGRDYQVTPSAYATLEYRLGLIKRFSRCCPHCLSEEETKEVWPKLWRLRWFLCCPKHQTLLLTRCPTCRGSWLSLRRAPDGVHPLAVANLTHRPPPPNTCHGWRHGQNDWCRTPFSQMPTEPAPSELIEATTHFTASLTPHVDPNKSWIREAMDSWSLIRSPLVLKEHLLPSGIEVPQHFDSTYWTDEEVITDFQVAQVIKNWEFARARAGGPEPSANFTWTRSAN